MKDAGARGPAAPKPPATPATRGGSPPAPPVAPARPAVASAQRVAPHAALTHAQQTPTPSLAQTKLTPKAPPVAAVAAMVAAAVAPVAPVVAPVAVSSPPPPDDGWDEEPTRVEDDELPTGMLQAAKALPAVSHHRAEPRADLRDHQATPAPSQDPRPIVKAAVDEAVTPLLRMVLDLQRRIEQLEQRPAAAAAAAPPTAAPPKQVDPWASAMARPVSSPPPATPAPAPAPAPPPAPARAPVARSPWALPEGPTGPTLDVAQINRDVPLDFDMPFDGARRRRRMAIGCVMVFVLSLGGLLAILVSSYMR